MNGTVLQLISNKNCNAADYISTIDENTLFPDSGTISTIIKKNGETISDLYLYLELDPLPEPYIWTNQFLTNIVTDCSITALGYTIYKQSLTLDKYLLTNNISNRFNYLDLDIVKQSRQKQYCIIKLTTKLTLPFPSYVLEYKLEITV